MFPPLIFELARVVAQDGIAQVYAVEVGVNLGCEDAFVAQHGLHRAKIRAVLHQVRREGMAEGVWADVFVNSRLRNLCFYQIEYGDAAQFVPESIDKQYISAFFFCGDCVSDGIAVEGDVLERLAADGHESFFFSFSRDR